MSKDIRVALSFFSHHKTKRLHQVFGDGGIVSLWRLWAYCAEHQPDGNLSRWDEFLFKTACERDADCMQFVELLASPEIHFLNKDEKGCFSIHDWDEHQPWVFYSKKRSRIAKENAIKGWNKRYQNSTGMQSACGQRATGMQPVKIGNAPSPTPIPIPSPIPSPESKDMSCEPDSRMESDISFEPETSGKKKKIPKTAKPKAPPDPRVKILAEFFIDTCMGKLGYEPDVDYPKECSLLKSKLGKGFTEEDIRELIVYAVSSEKFREHPTLAAMLTPHTINAWQMQRRTS